MLKKHIEISDASSQFADSDSLQRQEGQSGQPLPLLGLFLSISSKIKNWEIVWCYLISLPPQALEMHK